MKTSGPSSAKAVAEAVRAFCRPHVVKWVNGLGQSIAPTIECADPGCGESLSVPVDATPRQVGRLRRSFAHSKDCCSEVLLREGPSDALVRRLARRAMDLDYEGGGYGSCPLCKGRTAFQENEPAHRIGCPGAAALEALGRKVRYEDRAARRPKWSVPEWAKTAEQKKWFRAFAKSAREFDRTVRASDASRSRGGPRMLS